MRTALTYLNPGSVQSHQCGRPQSLPPPRTDLANTGPPSASGSRLKRVLSLPLIPRALKFLESGPSTARQERRKAGLIHTCLSSPHAASWGDLPGNPEEAGGFEHRHQRKAADDPFGLVSEHPWLFLPCEYRAESGPSWACGHVCLCVCVNHAHERGEREPFQEKPSGWLCVAKYKTSSKQLLQPNTRGVSACVRGAVSAPPTAAVRVLWAARGSGWAGKGFFRPLEGAEPLRTPEEHDAGKHCVGLHLSNKQTEPPKDRFEPPFPDTGTVLHSRRPSVPFTPSRWSLPRPSLAGGRAPGFPRLLGQ